MAGVPNQVCTAQYEYAGDGCLVQGNQDLLFKYEYASKRWMFGTGALSGQCADETVRNQV